MRIAMLGTRGVPARYGGFETAVEEVGKRLAALGEDVVVFCRSDGAEELPPKYEGMSLIKLPAARFKALETLSHTGLSVGHIAIHRAERFDAAIVFNAANAPYLPILRALRIPAAVHVDGLEWRRTKWSGAGRKYYRAAEALSVRLADALIADAQGIADYYTDEFGAPTTLLRYGAPIQDNPSCDRIAEIGLSSKNFHLLVARFEPENHVLDLVRGYRRSDAKLPLVVVGSAPYADEYTQEVQAAAEDDSRIRLVGPIWDQEQLDQMYAGALTYLHGHSVGGTNPSLLRAMGAGTYVIAWDVQFNREVLGGHGSFVSSEAQLADVLAADSEKRSTYEEAGHQLRERARTHYQWDEVAEGYRELLQRMVAGQSIHGTVSGRRHRPSGWE